jgi:GLPGLI family protein
MDMQIESPIVYKDFDKNEIISEESILDKPFLVIDAITDYQWSIGDEEDVIANMKCNKAIGHSPVGEITAWFCPDISISDGPYVYTGLPGVILKVEAQNTVITAKEVQSSIGNDDVLFKKPNKGKKIKRAAFEKLKAKKIKQVGEAGTLNVNVRVN